MAMFRTGWILAALLLLMAPALAVSPSRSLQVHTDSGTRVWCVPVSRNDMLQLQFTHSMFGGYVREQWVVTSTNQLERTRFVTENAAAAEYYATDGTSFQDSDGFVVPGEPLLQSRLVVRVNNRGDHRLSVNGQSIHLAGVLPQNTQVRISIMSEPCVN